MFLHVQVSDSYFMQEYQCKCSLKSRKNISKSLFLFYTELSKCPSVFIFSSILIYSWNVQLKSLSHGWSGLLVSFFFKKEWLYFLCNKTTWILWLITKSRFYKVDLDITWLVPGSGSSQGFRKGGGNGCTLLWDSGFPSSKFTSYCKFFQVELRPQLLLHGPLYNMALFCFKVKKSVYFCVLFFFSIYFLNFIF